MPKVIYKCDDEVVSREVFIENLVFSLEEDEIFMSHFNEWLDEYYEEVEILGVSFSPSTIMQELGWRVYGDTLHEHAETRALELVEYAEKSGEKLECKFQGDNFTITFE